MHFTAGLVQSDGFKITRLCRRLVFYSKLIYNLLPILKNVNLESVLSLDFMILRNFLLIYDIEKATKINVHGIIFFLKVCSISRGLIYVFKIARV